MEEYVYTDQDGDQLKIESVHTDTAGHVVSLAIPFGGGNVVVHVKAADVPDVARALCRYAGRGPVEPVLCGAMISPDPATRYDCTRRSGHAGSHLDDAQNFAWESQWDPKRTTTEDLPAQQANVPRCGKLLHWLDKESDTISSCNFAAGHSGLHGEFGTGDYVGGRAPEEVLYELLNRVNALECRTA